MIKPDLWEHVVHPILPGELYDEKKLLDDTGATSSSTRRASS